MVRLVRSSWVLLAALTLASCTSGNKTATTSVVTTSTTVAVTTPPLPAIHFGSAEEAVRHLFLEWKAGDRDAARQAASADAVATLFSRPAGDNQFRGCSHPKDLALGSDCTYQYGQGLLQMHVSFIDNNWTVTQVQFQTP